MEERRNVDVDVRRSQERKEVELRKSYEAEIKKKHEFDEQRRVMEEKRTREMELRRREKSPERPPPVRIVDVKPILVQSHFDHGVPDLEEEEIPDLEYVDDDIDIDGPPPPVRAHIP